MIYKAVWAFDVDDTLRFEGAPFPGNVIIADIARLRSEGNITGICGNWQVVLDHFRNWYLYFSFFGPFGPGITKLNRTLHKHEQLKDLKTVIRADRYIMVGNRRGDPDAHPGSQDDSQARLAGWDFIEEGDWQKIKV
jgi:hypothetical protein